MFGAIASLFKPKDPLPLLTVRPWKPGERERREANRRVNAAWMYRKEYQQPLYLEASHDSEQ